MEFFNSAVGVLQTLVIALGAGLGIWGAINLMEGYGNDNPGAKSQGMKQLMQKAENYYMQDNEREMHIVTDELYFVISEQQHSVDMTDKGHDLLANAVSNPDFFVLPDVGSQIAEIQKNTELSAEEKQEKKDAMSRPVQKVSLDDLFSQIKEGEMKTLNIIVKADVQGSAEAVKISLEKLSNEEVNVRVIHCAVGAINESDVMLAATSNAIIVGFNVRPDAAARDSAARNHVDMRMYRVIYDAIDEIEAAMKGMLAPKFREVLLGHAEVRQTYKVSGVGTVAGCYVQDGKLQRKDCQVRLVRDGIVIHEGVLASLQRFKDSVKEVVAGYECGLSIEKFNDIKEGDIVEAFTMEQIEV